MLDNSIEASETHGAFTGHSSTPFQICRGHEGLEPKQKVSLLQDIPNSFSELAICDRLRNKVQYAFTISFGIVMFLLPVGARAFLSVHTAS